MCAPSQPSCTVAVFGHDALGHIFIGLIVLAVLAVIIGLTIQKQHGIGILFDRTGITQVAQLGAAAAAAVFFHRTGKL